MTRLKIQYNQFIIQMKSNSQAKLKKINEDILKTGVTREDGIIDDEINQLREQNYRLKRLVKQSQAKRNATVKQCGQLTRKIENLESELYESTRKLRDFKDKAGGDNYKVQQLHFLNKQLNNEVESLRIQNENLMQKLRYNTTVIEKKYEDLKQNTFRKIESAMKRVKKAITYLSTLSSNEIHKTKHLLVQNLEKSLELLKGRYIDEGLQDQVTQLLNPLTSLKQQMTKKDKEIKSLKQKLERAKDQYTTQQRLNKEVIPQYKQTIEKLKKSLSFCRAELAQAENQKSIQKKQFQQKILILEQKNSELTNKLTKLKLQKKLYQEKLDQLEGDAEQQKQRLIHQNQILKKLYKTDQQTHERKKQDRSRKQDYSGIQSRRVQIGKYQQDSIIDRKDDTQSLKKYRSRESLYELKKSVSKDKLRRSRSGSGDRISGESSNIGTQKSEIKNEIDLIDQQILQIQKCLNRQLQSYNPMDE